MNSHQLRRVPQTLRAFRHSPRLLADVVRGAERGPAELDFVTRSGLRIVTPNQPGARVPVYEVFAEDAYALDWFLGPLPRDLHALDIGAHVGCFAVALTALKPASTVTCFEPSAATAAYTRRNAQANGLLGRVEVVEQAVAAVAGTAQFADNGAGSALNGLLSGPGTGTGTTVTTTTFDDVVAASARPVSVVKLDCEGGEYDLVLASSPASWRDVQRVVLEYHPDATRSWADLRAWFTAEGLLVVRHEPQGPEQGTAWLSRVGA